MNVRLPLLSLFFSLAFLPLSAQVFRPLAGHEVLTPQLKGKAVSQLTKTNCEEFDLSAFELLAAGEALELAAGLDTAGLGGGPFTYRCDGCADASAGTALIRDDSLFYGADAGAEFALDTLRLSVCNNAGMCSTEKTFIVLVRRADREISLGTFTVAPRGDVDVLVPADDLPGGATCRTMEACATDYDARGQEFFFLTDQRDGNEFRYRAAGLDGVDQVCVTLCNDFGMCDTYTAGFSINVAPVGLPFFDDFAYDGVRPNPALWQDDDVLINRNFAQDPPSIGVATFDGVDVTGQPYEGGNGGQRTVVRDYLTSSPVNLRDSTGTTLTFYLQPRGFGNRPETQDSFLVEFLDVAGTWNTVYKKEGVFDTWPNNEPLPFEPVLLAIPDEYLYNGFQFRFASKSSEQGAVDMWHLDYVKLSKIPTPFLNDVAIVETPSVLLAPPYTSMPIRHFRGGENLLADSIYITLRNFSLDERPVNTDSRVVVIDNIPNSPFAVDEEFNIVFKNIGGTDNSVPGETVITASATTVPFTQLRRFLNTGYDEDASIKLALTYDLEIPSQSGDFDGGVLLNNDFATQSTCFDNYMAYDDGTAEVIIEGNQGTTILQKYEAFVADELKGIRIRIPRVLGSLGSQEIKLVVYTGDGQPDPDSRVAFDFPIRYAETYFRDSLQGYTTYIFPEIVPLQAGIFYVGWEQQRADRNIGVGFDRNNAPENVQWFDNGNGFMPITGTTMGAIMVRPLLSGFEGFPTSVPEYTEADALVDVFPNPTNGTLYLRPRPTTTGSLNYRLFSLTGALLAADQVRQAIELGHLPAGIYLLEVTDGTAASRHKVVRR
ncbi:MAG: hypothetical protein ACJATN_000697 [Neolewinella sp.]|jgi:hypothetical protein